jgi:hypothetical protein
MEENSVIGLFNRYLSLNGFPGCNNYEFPLSWHNIRSIPWSAQEWSPPEFDLMKHQPIRM